LKSLPDKQQMSEQSQYNEISNGLHPAARRVFYWSLDLFIDEYLFFSKEKDGQ